MAGAVAEVRMLNVQRVVGRDGVERLYLRKKGLPSTRLRAAFGTPELEAEVAGLIAALSPETALPGTLKAATLRYEQSVDFKNLAASTRYEYGLILKELDATVGSLAIARFTPRFVMQLRDQWALRGHRAANIRLQLLANVLARPVIDAQLARCPVEAVPAVARPAHLPEPHVLWSDEALLTVMEAAIAQERYGLARAVALGRYTGARRGDLVRLLPRARAGGRVRWLSGKRKVPVDIAEDPALTTWLGRIPARQPDSARAGRKIRKGATPPTPATLVFSLANVAYTEDGLGQALADLVTALQRAGALERGSFNLHGLRHTRGVELALKGLTDAEGAAQLGHSSPSSFAQYRRQADRLRLALSGEAKLHRLPERAGNTQVENNLENGCKTAGGAA